MVLKRLFLAAYGVDGEWWGIIGGKDNGRCSLFGSRCFGDKS